MEYMPRILEPLYFDQAFSAQSNFEFKEEFIQSFIEDGVVVIRDFDCSLEDQKIITNNFKYNFPELFCLENPLFHYSENHQYTVDMRLSHGDRIAGQDDIFVSWHMEMIGYPNPATGATWNMRKFECDIESGKTFFYDAIQLINEISKNDIELLKKCKYKINDVGSMDIIENKQLICPIKKHAISNKELIYVDPSGNYSVEESPDGSIDLCKKLIENIILKIKTNKNNLIIHKWKEKDIVFVDLSRMYHAVTGGFQPSQRHFEGLWLHSFAGSKYGTI